MPDAYSEQAETVGQAVPEAADETRLAPATESLRHIAARGTVINAAFQIGLSGLATLKRLVVVAFLTRAEFGIWGIMLSVLVTLSWLKEIGVADKYIQQTEPDQEAAFQKAFTLELIASVGFFLLSAAALPLFALAYGHLEIIVPGLVLAATIPLSAFESPAWIPYRRLQYARQRALMTVDPVVTLSSTIVLGLTGFGYWALVLGALAGTIAGGLVCVATCPYPVRLRFERGTLGEYASFSTPLVGAGLARLVVVQGSLLVANHRVGLAGIGAIGLATSIATFADRVDGLVSGTIYPAVCRVADRADALAEAFVKSNRLALMWAMPFAVAVALFAGDFVHFVIGDRWQPAVGLLVAFALTCGFGQLAFNWAIFMRAVNRTGPLFVGAVVDLGVFFAVSVPAMLVFGVGGYAAGFAAATLVQICVRTYYMERLMPGFKILRQLSRSIAPVVPPTALLLVVRTVAGGDRTPALAIAELVVYALATIALTYVLERALVRELFGYLRRPARPAPAAG